MCPWLFLSSSFLADSRPNPSPRCGWRAYPAPLSHSASVLRVLRVLTGVTAPLHAPQTQNPVTYRKAKTFPHFRYNGDWKKENGGYQAHLDPIWRLEWAQQTTIFSLCSGHCGLGAHLKRIGISDTSLCECGQADQTPDCVPQSCPNHVERRQLT